MTHERFAGMSALVTGAARGIGLAIAARLVAEGAIVVLADIDGDAGRAAATALGERARSAQVDVTSRSDVERVMDFASEAGAIDLLVSNVGVALEAPFETLTDGEWGFQIAASLTGTFLTTQIAAPYLSRSLFGGRGVLIGSVNGLTGYGHEAYSAAKAAVHNLTHNLAMRYGPSGVRFNAVAPGTIVTEAWKPRVQHDPGLLTRLSRHYPLRRLGEPVDVAAAVSFLLSDDARWITGVVLPVDGGLTAGSVALAHDRQGENDGSGL